MGARSARSTWANTTARQVFGLIASTLVAPRIIQFGINTLCSNQPCRFIPSAPAFIPRNALILNS